MNRAGLLIAIVSLLATAAPVAAQQVLRAGSHAELQAKFCAVNEDKELVLIVPARLFVDSQLVICESGPYKLYRIVSAQDTDDFEYWMDPPFYDRGIRLGCDGKAGRTMETVALNCRPL